MAHLRQLAHFHHVSNVYQRRSQVMRITYLSASLHCISMSSHNVYLKIPVLINWPSIYLIIYSIEFTECPSQYAFFLYLGIYQLFKETSSD